MRIASDWFDGTRHELDLPEGWTRATVKDRAVFVEQAQGKELFFGVRKALPAPRVEEDTLQACRTIAFHEALSLSFWPGIRGARLLLFVSSIGLRRPVIKFAVAGLWMIFRRARIVPVSAGPLGGHVLCTREDADTR